MALYLIVHYIVYIYIYLYIYIQIVYVYTNKIKKNI